MATAATVAAILLGSLLIAWSVKSAFGPPVPAPSVSATAPSAEVQSAAPLSVKAAPAMSSSVPTRVQAPSIGVDSDLMALGLQPDRTVEVPPLSNPERAGWFKYGATPGAAGPAVILGHIDGGGKKGVFYKLADTKPGAQITVARADGQRAVFTVSAVRQFPKTDFPTQLVYGKTPTPELRLITCGGVLDRKARNYLSNVVVFATMTGASPA